MGLVYQAFVNYPNWNVFRNIASPLLARGTERAAVEQKVVELATRLQIEALLERQPHELSGGQQQRVAIARALAQGGRVLARISQTRVFRDGRMCYNPLIDK